MKDSKIKQIALVGVMAAAVYVASLLQIPIMTAIDGTRIHLGNVMCLLAGILLGPVSGGLAAGIGSALFDVTCGWFTSIPFTFLFKFIMGYLCGKIVLLHKPRLEFRYAIGGITGAFTYVILYLSKSFIEDYFISGGNLAVVAADVFSKGIVSGLNAIIAVVVAVPLGLVLRPLLTKLKA